jgi:hypothetical protein
MSTKRILIGGYPSTGKTTYIAALWNYVKAHGENKSLELNSVAGAEHEYLNGIGNDWLEYKCPTRNLLGTNFEKVVMNLKKLGSTAPILLEIPDMDGEKFKAQFELREWPQDYDLLIDEIVGGIFFVSPVNKNNRPQFVEDAIALEEAAGGQAAVVAQNANLATWNVEFVCNQVKVVETFQFLEHHKLNSLPFKISIVVSAWDKIHNGSTITPSGWIKRHMPLVYQYLETNKDIFTVEYFGVSAQGGDYERNDELEKLMEKNPIDRIVVKTGNEKGNNIAKPILWITD